MNLGHGLIGVHHYSGGMDGNGLSGVVQSNANGNFGFTDFREFTVGAGLPTGITDLSYNGTATGMAIANDVSEGNYFAFTPEDTGMQAFSIDSLDGGMAYGEVLARVYIPAEELARRSCGPMFQMAGDGTGANTYAVGGNLFYRTISPDDYESHIVQINAGSESVIAQGDWQIAESDGGWIWMRMRCLNNGATDDWNMKTWLGGLGDEPVGWDVSNGGSFKAPNQGSDIGFGVIASAANRQMRIAYLAFSEQPWNNPTPEPE